MQGCPFELQDFHWLSGARRLAGVAACCSLTNLWLDCLNYANDYAPPSRDQNKGIN